MNSVTPYIGGGFGISNVNLEVASIAGATTNFDDSDTIFAYQASVGIQFSISNDASLDLGYRFFAAHDPVHDDGVDEVEMDYQDHSAMVRLIFHLWLRRRVRQIDNVGLSLKNPIWNTMGFFYARAPKAILFIYLNKRSDSW